MDLPFLFINDEHKDIPREFQSDVEEEPLKECIVCGTDLMDGTTPYLIEKAFKRYKDEDLENTIFEFAICAQCHQKQREELSEESMQRIDQFFAERVDMVKRREQLMEETGETKDHRPWLNRCIITGKPIEECDEYQIVGEFQGNQLLFTYMPMMISDEGADMITELMSNETLDELDDFSGTYLTGPPELEELFRGRPVLV